MKYLLMETFLFYPVMKPTDAFGEDSKDSEGPPILEPQTEPLAKRHKSDYNSPSSWKTASVMSRR